MCTLPSWEIRNLEYPDPEELLNKRSEIASRCPHQKTNSYWEIMTVKTDWLLNKYILNTYIYRKINFVYTREF